MVIQDANRSFSVAILRHASENGNLRRGRNFFLRKVTPKFWQNVSRQPKKKRKKKSKWNHGFNRQKIKSFMMGWSKKNAF